MTNREEFHLNRTKALPVIDYNSITFQVTFVNGNSRTILTHVNKKSFERETSASIALLF